MKKLSVIGSVLLGVIILAFLGLYAVDFIDDENGQMGDILMWLVIILIFFHGATWGNDSKAEKDEMGRLIKNKSGKISYYILTFILFAFWLIDSLVNENLSGLGNIFLLTALCLAMILYPSYSFFVVRRMTK